LESSFLVVSDPPHDSSVNIDIVSSILGLEDNDARLKVGFRAPEVLEAADDDRCERVAESLRGAGLTVAVLDGRSLVGLPWPTTANAVALGEHGLMLTVGHELLPLPWDEDVIGVYCRPPIEARPPSDMKSLAASSKDARTAAGLAVAEALEWMPHLDLFFHRDGELRRITIARDLTDFTGLGDVTGLSSDECMAATVAECEQRFANIVLDARLEDVRPRARFMLGIQDFDYDLRKAFSFGTLLLRSVLDTVSPELRDLTQYELGARLAYVLRTR